MVCTYFLMPCSDLLSSHFSPSRALCASRWGAAGPNRCSLNVCGLPKRNDHEGHVHAGCMIGVSGMNELSDQGWFCGGVKRGDNLTMRKMRKLTFLTVIITNSECLPQPWTWVNSCGHSGTRDATKYTTMHRTAPQQRTVA